jgi:hypothetical protein
MRTTMVSLCISTTAIAGEAAFAANASAQDMKPVEAALRYVREIVADEHAQARLVLDGDPLGDHPALAPDILESARRTMGFEAGRLDALLSCLPEPQWPKICSLPDDTVVVRMSPPALDGARGEVEVAWWHNSGRTVQLVWYKLELTRGAEGWYVSKVLGRGAS